MRPKVRGAGYAASNIPHQKAVVLLGGVQSTDFSRVFTGKPQLKLLL